MSEDRKKKRIAHIGNIANVQLTAKVHNDDESAQADCNLVYNIMQSMDASQVMSYQQLQEFKSKENFLSRVNYSDQNSCKQNGKTVISKQIKKFQEKTFPLMAKCQKSMTFLKKNRCIPKPRAHVGFIPRPPQRPISDSKLNDRYHSVSANKRLHNESRKKINQNPKKSRRSTETSSKAKKPKISRTVENSCDKNTHPTGICEKNSKLTNNAETDSDNEFEQFLMDHHPSKCVASSYSSDSSAGSRKVKKSDKIKRKKGKQTVYLAKMRKGKVTRKTLTESEESAESQDERVENNCIGEDDFTKDSCNRQFPSKKFQRIIRYDNSDDSVSDSNLNDTGALNCDSYNSSDDDSEHLNILPSKPSPVASSSTALSEFNDASCNILKLKCEIPCYVVIKRDPLLEQKVASMCTDNTSVIEMVPVSNERDDDDLSDCIIITETATNVASDNSDGKRLSIANNNSYQRNATGIDKPLPVSEIINKNVKNKNMHDEKMLFNSNSCRPRTDMVMEVQMDKVNVKERSSVNVSSKFLSDVGKACGKEPCIFANKTTENSHINVNTLEYDEKDTFNKEETSTEIEAFNVQILSVKSLNESDVIVLSDDSDENDMEFEPIINESNGTSTGDSDVEIICLDLNDINKEKSANENIRNSSKHGLHNKVNNSNEYSRSSSIQPIGSNEENCIVLDNTEISSESNCTAQCVAKVQRSSQLTVQSVDRSNNEKKNSNTEETLTNNVSDLDKNSILKILNTIDFNCIQKVLKETTINDTRIGKNSDGVSAKVENSLCANIETSKKTEYSFSADRNQKDAYHAKEGLINASILCGDSSAINKTSRMKASPVDTYEVHNKLVKNANILHNKNDVPERVPIPVKLDNVPSSNNCDKSPAFCNSNANKTAIKASVSEKKIIATSPKTELNTLLLPEKNQQLLPRCTKIESNESTADILDVLVVKSIQNLEEKRKKTILPLVELYQTEYKKFMEIKSTEKNVTAGLKLLEENQARKLMQISSSIKNIAENDKCFHKVKNKFVSKSGEHSFPVRTDGSLIEVEKPVKCQPGPSNSTWSDIKKDAKVKIFSDAVIEGASEILNLQAVGPASSQKVYNHLINSVCVECGKHAMAACLGCAKVFYCSEKCGMSYWDKGHYASCKR